ncbi:MAG: nucleotidyl transferase AbiEii/AbiGii toxin family protein [Bacteroidales bacterium]|nr:nucleotidyl transferase AbiEii/AbiGii toxin family protein [Bacteroidales bacterium]
MALLEGLSESSMQFIFKGGTALMLLFQKPHRLSIDIDIIVNPQEGNIENVLKSIFSAKGFIRFEEQIRPLGNNIPVCHYKFYYTSAVEGKESYILLDILFEDNPYNSLVEIPIDNVFVDTQAPAINVKVPDFNNLLADKMTAFAPQTIGVPYKKKDVSCGMEIIKQLYDIGCLFDKASDIQSISNTYHRIANQELSYRGHITSVDVVLRDTIDNALSICFRKAYHEADFDTLYLGTKQVGSFIFSEHFHIEKAILAAAKTVYLSALLLSRSTTIEKYSDKRISDIADWAINEYEYTKLNKLKKTYPEAFFYLYLALQQANTNQ